jgi:hypothetical protein
MAPLRKKYRTIYMVTAAMMVALIGGYALAATTVTPNGPNQGSNITTSPTSGWAAGSVTSEQLVALTPAMIATNAAGNQSVGAAGLAGTTWRLAVCSVAPCAAQSFRSTAPASPVVGDYAEQVVLTITQPTTASASASGFDFVFTFVVSINGGANTPLSFQGYLATGSTGAGTAMSIPVFLFMDLGTQLTVVIVSINAVFNTCATTTACP